MYWFFHNGLEFHCPGSCLTYGDMFMKLVAETQTIKKAQHIIFESKK